MWGGGAGTSGRGRWQGMGGRRMNKVQIMCAHVSKCKKARDIAQW
jgi:hypothetical protein